MITGISGKINSGKDLVGQIILWLLYCKRMGSIPYTFEEWNNHENKYESGWKIKKYADKLKEIVCLLIGCTREQLEDREFKEKELGTEWNLNIYLIINGDGDVLFETFNEEISKSEQEFYSQFIECKIQKFERKLTPRLLLQLLGTECGRQIIHPNIWVNALMSGYKSQTDTENLPTHSFIELEDGSREFQIYPNWIITDCRFPNEADAIKEKRGINIKINRFNQIENLEEGDEYYVVDNNEAIWTVFDDESRRDINEFKTKEEALSFINSHESETALDNYKFDYTIENNGTIEELIEKVKEILIEEKII